jgi:hypothetical protein
MYIHLKLMQTFAYQKILTKAGQRDKALLAVEA